MLQNRDIEAQKDQALRLIASRVVVPAGYEFKSVLLLSHDLTPVFVFRYERADGKNASLGGEHFSVSVDLEATKIMGIMHVAELHCGPGLPNDEEAKETARAFLAKVAPDLEGKYEIKWVLSLKENPKKLPHESPFPFVDDAGQEYLITGVRVKLFFEHLNSWGWVIVGREGGVVSFEREVTWSAMMNRRSTPAWLHDVYINELLEDLQGIQ